MSNDTKKAMGAREGVGIVVLVLIILAAVVKGYQWMGAAQTKSDAAMGVR